MSGRRRVGRKISRPEPPGRVRVGVGVSDAVGDSRSRVDVAVGDGVGVLGVVCELVAVGVAGVAVCGVFSDVAVPVPGVMGGAVVEGVGVGAVGVGGTPASE